MTQLFSLQSLGGLRQFSDSGRKVIKMQGNANRLKSNVETLTSGSNGGKVEIIMKSEQMQLRPVGLCRGQFMVPDDFDDPLPDDILEEFEGR